MGMLEYMKLSNKIYFALFFVLSFMPSLAYADKILDKVEIVQTKTETEIHIEFLTQVRYLRHAPSNKESSRIQIFLEFPQFTKGTLPEQREFRNSPRTNLVPSFTVNYPEQQTNSIGVRFKKAIKFTVAPDNSGRGIVIHVPNGKVDAALEPVVQAPVQPVVEHGPQGELPVKSAGMSDNDYAGKLVAEAKSARGVGDHPKVVQLLNEVLNLPANSYVQEAQELIGVSREKMGEYDKAKAEYETYLKLYPQGEGASRVRQRLAVIGANKASVPSAEKPKSAIREIHENTVYGSLNQYYYDAHSHNYNADPTTNTHSHDQSQLISSIDLTARFRQNEWDNKIVLRDTHSMGFLQNGNNRNKLQAAYVEINNKESDYLARLGRQNGNSGGVLGRFDGALFRYALNPKYKLNFVLGALDEYQVDYRRHFYGVNLDIGPINDSWSGNVYYINQQVGDVKDREAVGAEVRYFNKALSVYSLADYDTMFNKLNIAMIQGNLLTESGVNYNMLVDHRKAPILTMVNSLPAYFGIPGAGTTVSQVKQSLGLTDAQIMRDAVAQTLNSDLVLFGATKQLTPRWQIGGDVQVTRTSGTQAAGQAAVDAAIKKAADNGVFIDPLSLSILQASAASGNTWTYHAQVVGSDTIFKNDTSLISLSYTDAPTSKNQSIVFSNSMVPSEKWRLDNSIRFLRVEIQPLAQQSILSYVISPTMRASYRLRDKATLEAEIGLEVTNTNDPTVGHNRTFRDFSFVGYRLDI